MTGGVAGATDEVGLGVAAGDLIGRGVGVGDAGVGTTDDSGDGDGEGDGVTLEAAAFVSAGGGGTDGRATVVGIGDDTLDGADTTALGIVGVARGEKVGVTLGTGVDVVRNAGGGVVDRGSGLGVGDGVETGASAFGFSASIVNRSGSLSGARATAFVPVDGGRSRGGATSQYRKAADATTAAIESAIVSRGTRLGPGGYSTSTDRGGIDASGGSVGSGAAAEAGGADGSTASGRSISFVSGFGPPCGSSGNWESQSTPLAAS